MGTIARKHHYIPKFYLEGFTTSENDGKLFVFDKDTYKQWLSYTKNIAYQNDLYKIEKGDDIDVVEDTLEQCFAEFEAMVAPVIKEMEYKRELPEGEKFSILINFIALMHCRVPSMNELSINPLKDISRIMLDMVTANKERYESYIKRLKAEGIEFEEDIDYAQMREFVTSNRYTIDVNQNYKMRVLLEKVDIVIPLLAARRWSLLFTDDSKGGFICSDNPVALISLTELPPFMSPGFGMKNTEVSIPLTKNMAMVGRFSGKEEVGWVTPKTLAAINSRSAMYSEKFIFSSKENFIFIDRENNIFNKEKLIIFLQEENKEKGKGK